MAPDDAKTFGPFALEHKLGAGGMGVVYRATDTRSGEAVAVKLLKRDLFSDDPERRVQAIRRFEREARTAMALDHPGIVKVREQGELGGRHYLVMEHVSGERLDKVIAGTPMAPRRAAELAHKIAIALAHAHAEGVIHRDLKPENVLLGPDDQPRVVDFGLARFAGGSALTLTGQVIGTPQYMSPEQVSGDTYRIGPASDVYSLGAILYQMLTGERPFDGESLVEVIFKVASQAPPNPSDKAPGLDPDLEAICLRCLHKSSRARYPNAEALARALERYLAGHAQPAAEAGPSLTERTKLIWRKLSGKAKRWFQPNGKRAENCLKDATTAARKGELAKARELFAAAIEDAPDRWEPRAELGELLLKENEPQQAAIHFFQAFGVASDPERRALMAFRASDALMEARQSEMARHVLEQARDALAGTRFGAYVEERLSGL